MRVIEPSYHDDRVILIWAGLDERVHRVLLESGWWSRLCAIDAFSAVDLYDVAVIELEEDLCEVQKYIGRRSF